MVPPLPAAAIGDEENARAAFWIGDGEAVTDGRKDWRRGLRRRKRGERVVAILDGGCEVKWWTWGCEGRAADNNWRRRGRNWMA